MTKTVEAFRITSPSGKTYRIFADGHIEGFEGGSIICNYIPALLASAEVRQPDGRRSTCQDS